MAGGLTSTLPRSTCGKCVRVLKELISGLDDEREERSNNNDERGNKKNENSYESPPLTLLRAIARSSREHPQHDQWGQERKLIEPYRQQLRRQRTHATSLVGASSIAGSIANAIATAEREQNQQQHPPALKIEETEDGVKLTIPVETTSPALMKPWTHLPRPLREQEEERSAEEDDLEDSIFLATSVRRDDDEIAASRTEPVTNPLTIELKCRKCETSGPEAGARAFLMGPEPLSIVLCHNRIDADRAEVEEILTHELVHLYDVQTMKLDLSDCETVAYSEVRAAREAECHRSVRDAAKQAAQASEEKEATGLAAVTTQITDTLETRFYKPYCVKSIALGATQNMFPREGKSCLNKVWEKAYGDHRPFARFATPNGRNGEHPPSMGSNGQAGNRRHESSGTIHGTSDK